MKKNKYNFPQRATNSNNPIYNQYVEDMYYENEYHGPKEPDMRENTPKWKRNGRIDLFHEQDDNTDPHQDPYTVAEHYYERKTMPHG